LSYQLFSYNRSATPESYTLSLHDALPILSVLSLELGRLLVKAPTKTKIEIVDAVTTVLHTNNFEIVRNEEEMLVERIKIILIEQDRKSTRLNSSHVSISYAVFCLKKKKKK